MTTLQLRGELQKVAKGNPSITILVKADVANNYGAVVDVLKELHAVGITKIGLMTQEETPPRVARR